MTDLQNGNLRRPRGVDYLSDDDDDIAAQSRREARRRAMRQKLLEDEKLNNLNNPKTQAFLRSVEDKDDIVSFLESERTPTNEYTSTELAQGDETPTQSQMTTDYPEQEPPNQNSVSKSKALLGSTNADDIRHSLADLVDLRADSLNKILDAESSDQEKDILEITFEDRIAQRRASTLKSSSNQVAFRPSGSFSIPDLPRRLSTLSTRSNQSSESSDSNHLRAKPERSISAKKRSTARISVNYQPRASKQKQMEIANKIQRNEFGKRRRDLVGVIDKNSKWSL